VKRIFREKSDGSSLNSHRQKAKSRDKKLFTRAAKRGEKQVMIVDITEEIEKIFGPKK